MDFKKLIRNPDKVIACLEEIADGRLIAKKAIKIYIPSRFAERDLADLGVENNIVGVYAIVVDDTYYGVSMVNAMVRIDPTSVLKVMCDGEEYIEFYFAPGSTVICSLSLVRSDFLVYSIYNEILAKGRIPWYLSYDDLAGIFDTAKYHAGTSVGDNREVTELIISLIARDVKNRHNYYRTVPQALEDVMDIQPAYVGLKSVVYSATNTLNKIAGSYMSDGLVSALVSPTTRVERMENLLRY